MTHAESRELADRIAELAADKLAVDVVVIDLHDVIGYTDFFVICSGNTERQTKAIHDGVHLGMKQARASCLAASRGSTRRAGSSWTTST